MFDADPLIFHDWLRDPARRPLVMGVLNVTPDSFSDGGAFLAPDAAKKRLRELADEGAEWIDIGAESTRPGAAEVAAHEQIRRLSPVFDSMSELPGGIVLSIDTTSAAVAEFAFSRGVHAVNDISAGRHDSDMFSVVSRFRRAIVLMHMQGEPRTMQNSPHYGDVIEDVSLFLRERLAAAIKAGIDRERILIDPGIGFGKTTEHNLEILGRLREIAIIGPPVVIGTSRKRFIGQVTGVADVSQRQFGTAATIAWSIANGAAVVRVHDVAAMKQVVQMTAAIMNGGVQ